MSYLFSVVGLLNVAMIIHVGYATSYNNCVFLTTIKLFLLTRTLWCYLVGLCSLKS